MTTSQQLSATFLRHQLEQPHFQHQQLQTSAASAAATRMALKGIFLHLFRADTYARRVFWVVLTCVTTVACCYHAYLTLDQFSLTPVSTLILNQGADSVFPDVTLCNLRPMPQHLLHLDSPLRRRLEANIDSLLGTLRQIYGRDKALFHMHDYFHWYNLLQHFWASESTAGIGHNISQMLVLCLYKKSFCRSTDFALVQNAHFWNCWTFLPRDRSVQGTGPDDGLSLILYTSTVPRSEASRRSEAARVTYPPSAQRGPLQQLGTVFGKAGMQASEGVRVLLHEPGTYPHVHWGGVDIANGWSSSLRVRMTRNVYVNRSGHHCVLNYGNATYWTSEVDNQRRRFQRRGLDCVVSRWQGHLMRHCGCQSTYLPSQNRSSLCHHEHLNDLSQAAAARKARQLKCFNELEPRIRRQLYDGFVASCSRTQACEQVAYSHASVSVPWPSLSDLEAFYHTFVIPALRTRQFEGHQLLDEVMERSGPNRSSWSVGHSFVRDNFLRLNVYAEESKSTLIRESPSYSFVEVLSELGGIGGLWIGMSLVTFVELFEFLATLSVKCSQGLSNYLRLRRCRQAEQRGHANGAAVFGGSELQPRRRQTEQPSAAGSGSEGGDNHSPDPEAASIDENSELLRVLDDFGDLRQRPAATVRVSRSCSMVLPGCSEQQQPPASQSVSDNSPTVISLRRSSTMHRTVLTQQQSAEARSQSAAVQQISVV